LAAGRPLLALMALLGCIDVAAAQAVRRPQSAASLVRSSTPEAASGYVAAFDAWRATRQPKTAILAVRRGGETVFARGYNADPNQPTLIGSLSKAITAACVATLIRDEKISFTTKMRDTLAEFFRRYGRPIDARFEDVTIEQLLTHRSGLHDNREGDPFIGIRKERIAKHLAPDASPQPLLAAYLTQNPLVSAPGGAFAYSNTGYLALTAIIEERTGRQFKDYCREAVLAPLCLTGVRLHPDWRMLGGGGGWYISAGDYLAFLDIFDPSHPFLGKSVKAWIDAMRTHSGAKDERERYSLGMFTSARNGRWSIHHGGELSWRGRDAQGKPIAAIIGSSVGRSTDGIAVFVAATPKAYGGTQVAEMQEQAAYLRMDVARIAALRR
jgi:CubicO group peptidase (beta-lactamase class C family)